MVCVQKVETAGLGQTTFSLAKLVLDDLIIGHIKDDLSICTKSKKQLFRTGFPFQWPLKLKALHISKTEIRGFLLGLLIRKKTRSCSIIFFQREGNEIPTYYLQFIKYYTSLGVVKDLWSPNHKKQISGNLWISVDLFPNLVYWIFK